MEATEKKVYLVERDIQFGLLYHCLDWQDFGLISSAFGEKVFYFEKKPKVSFSYLALVAFVVSETDSSKAEHVTEIKIKNSSRVYFLNKKDIHEDGQYCGNQLNSLRQISEPVLVDIDSLDYIALVSENEESLFLYTHLLTSFQKYSLNLYKDKISNKPFTGVDLDELITKLTELNKYISEFDEDKVINSYKIYKYGYLQRRLGRDDHFHYGTIKTIDSDDPFIKSILPVGEDCDHEATNSSEEEYGYYDEENAKICINEAKEIYNRNLHMGYLLKIYLDDYYYNDEDIKYDYIAQNINELFGIRKVFKFGCFGSDNYQNDVHRYNIRNNH